MLRHRLSLLHHRHRRTYGTKYTATITASSTIHVTIPTLLSDIRGYPTPRRDLVCHVTRILRPPPSTSPHYSTDSFLDLSNFFDTLTVPITPSEVFLNQSNRSVRSFRSVNYPQDCTFFCNFTKRVVPNMFIDRLYQNLSTHLYTTEVENGNNIPSLVVLDSSNVEAKNGEESGKDYTYKELREGSGETKLGTVDRDYLDEIFRCFSRSGWASNQALAVYIGASFFPTAVHKFRRIFHKNCENEVVNYLVSLGPGEAADRFIFPIFAEFCLEECQDEMNRFKGMIESADLTMPHTWFPFARAMKRKIIYHCGPTNSGKTYNALQRFMEAKKGIYCSPLRLLAMEVFDKVNAVGVYCSLLTGQEKKHVPFSEHVACTVEMVSTEEMYDVAVIDEIQMMSDSYRGYAWTRALLGVQADEIHLCGDPSVLNIVRKICSETGDELYENHYERFKQLVVEAKTLLGDLNNVRSGDCVVAFSRREIFEVKLAIEKNTSHRCCVIYGALPPETRRQQANLFNSQDNEFDVLVASDAVGMGLNLNIRRVIFYTLSKYNGDKIVPVPPSQVKQIAGRAGRRGSLYPDGLTTTMHLDDLEYLIECLKKPFDDVKQVGLFPFFEQVELFAGQIPNITFPQLLLKFKENCRLDGSYFLCQHEHIRKVANMLEKIEALTLKDRFNFCFAPVNIRDPKAMYHLLRYASSYAQNLPVNIAMGIPKTSAKNDSELLDLETKHQVLSMYLWLSQHFTEETFPYVKKAEAMATYIADLLGKSLFKANWKPESRGQGKPDSQEKKDGYERPRSIVQNLANPQAIFKDPFRRGNNILVMCDAYTPAGEPIPTNKRYYTAKSFTKPEVAAEVPWYGIEQEYTLLQKEVKWPLGWPKEGYPGPQGPCYCCIGADKAFGRDIVDAHYKACLYAGINISGINGEVMPGQWEFQVGPAVGISAGDELWVSRYILERITEIAGAVVSFDPKPIKDDWNGAGAHCNYSTKTMREDGGYEVIKKAIEKLDLKHKETLLHMVKAMSVVSLANTRLLISTPSNGGLQTVVHRFELVGTQRKMAKVTLRTGGLLPTWTLTLSLL